MEHIYQTQGIWLHWFLDMVIVWQPLTSHETYLSNTGNLVTLVPGYGDCLAATYLPWNIFIKDKDSGYTGS